MRIERFEQELPLLFERFPESPHPHSRRFAELLEAVPGLARENNLALLNLAASLREPGERYVEVGAYRGTSLVAAMLGNDGGFVAIDDFSFREGSRGQLEGNLARFGLSGVEILEGDVFELLRAGALAAAPVGVYYYDAAHSYQEQRSGLELVEPYLAARALAIVDDSDWPQVAAATSDYLAGQPKARLLLEIPGKSRGLPAWWEGVQVLAWES